MKKDAINKCQYWSQNEPLQCEFWDDSNKLCIYKFQEEGNRDADFAPYCNLIGTSINCIKYKSPSPGSTEARCILPDSRRHVCNRITGYKWVTVLSGVSPETEDSYEVKAWDFAAINGYNEGQCDSYGTNPTCSGYAPYHLGFGVLQPSKEEDKYDTFKENRFSTTEEFGYRLPTNFVICNLRAVLSKCYWWNDSPGIFGVNESTGQVELGGIWNCNNPNDTSKYSEFTLENGPPCNGCKPECPYYTGVCWKYCVDEKMEDGDPILAEQIHELRYYHRENMWSVEAIENIFIDEGTIFTWDGTKKLDPNYTTLAGNISITVGNTGVDTQGITDYEIPSIKTYMDSFDFFDVKAENVLLTQGTTITKQLKDYPTLIREIQQLPLFPIIKNRFTVYSGVDDIKKTYFETPYLKESTPVLIYGKTFYNKPTYAINLSDKEVHAILPWIVYAYDNISECEQYIKSAAVDRFDDFMKYFKAALEAISVCLPGKIIPNTLASDELTFMMEVPALNKTLTYNNSAENVVMVWQEVDDYIAFSKIKFTKRFVGGILAQTEYSLEGDSRPTKTPFDYEESSNASQNENGQISFSFVPFVSDGVPTTPLNFFNDSVIQNPLSGKTSQGFKRYKLTADELILDDGQFISISSSGYALIDLDDPYLHSVFKPFEVDKINVKYTIDNPLAGEEGQSESISKDCEMEIVYHGAGGLIGPQQLLVKSKSQEDLASACDVWVTLEGLTFWDKRSYDDPPPEIDGFSVSEDNGDASTDLNVGELSGNSNEFILNNFGDAMTPSIVMANCQGKPFSVYRTKTISSVKQPACPDVEIFYVWEANYITYQNKPICKCCGPWSQINPVANKRSYIPSCGDHFQSIYQNTGPMWWPYNACKEWETYSQLTNLSNFSLDVVGLYQLKTTAEDGTSAWLHGSHDMRMQGPHMFYGHVGQGCNPLLPCSCNMRSYNSQKSSDNTFVGYAKIRAGVPTSQLDVWKKTGSILPKFGNAIRPLLRTYRSLDHIPYLSSTNKDVIWKLMPAGMMFNQADITSSEDQMWNWYCSDEGNNVVNPLGLFKAQAFDGVTINEELDTVNRFRHEEVFRCKWTVDIAYQHTVGNYAKYRGDTLIVPWYEFKRYPVGGSDNFIQWAWQEKWKELERNYSEEKNYAQSFIQYYIENKGTGFIKGPFMNQGGIKGYFLTLNINYPDYLHDYRNKEFRQIITEGIHKLSFMAPKKDDNTGEYLGYPAFKLDSGLQRGLNWDGDWLTTENADGQLEEGAELDDYNVEIYDLCIGDKHKTRETVDNITYEYVWSDDVTLFGNGYSNPSREDAEADERMCQTYYKDNSSPPKTITLKTHFQRGLNISINKDNLNTLPLKVIPVDQYNVIGNTVSTGMEIVAGKDEQGLPKTERIGFEFDSKLKTIGRVSVSCLFGTKLITEATATTEATYTYHHIPQIIIYSSDDGVIPKNELYRTDGVEVFTGAVGSYDVVPVDMEWTNEWEYISQGTKGLIIEFRCYPTEEEFAELSSDIVSRFKSNLNLFSILNSSLNEEILSDATETLNIHERKYYVSHGGSGDCPPQGTDDDEDLRVLGKRLGNDRSYVWQRDSGGMVADVPNSDGTLRFMNKVRGRIVFNSYEDEALASEGNDIIELEGKQKELYDLAVNEISQVSIMRGTLAPPIKDALDSAGVAFGGPGNLVLKNTVVTQLVNINNFPQMSGNGHRYQPASPKKEYCFASDPPCLDGGLGGDSYKFEYANLDAYLGDDILVNAVLYTTDPESGESEISLDGENLQVTSSKVFQVDTESKYGTTGDHLYGNPFDTIMTNPITQLYSGRSWQVERTMMYEALMDTVFPKLFNRSPSPQIYAEDYTGLEFPQLPLTSYGGIIDTSYTPSEGYSKQPEGTQWSDTIMWPDFSGLLPF